MSTRPARRPQWTTARSPSRAAAPWRHFADAPDRNTRVNFHAMRIIYLDVDSLSPSHLGCYGYCRDTSPAIDALARDGVRFEHVYCSDAPCLPSRTAFYSGRFGIQTGVVG